jgi:hypothetical protein
MPEFRWLEPSFARGGTFPRTTESAQIADSVAAGCSHSCLSGPVGLELRIDLRPGTLVRLAVCRIALMGAGMRRLRDLLIALITAVVMAGPAALAQTDGRPAGGKVYRLGVLAIYDPFRLAGIPAPNSLRSITFAQARVR